MNTMMKNRKLRFFLSFIIVFYTTSIYGQERPKMERFLSVKPTSSSFGAEGGSQTFTVNASGTWKIASNLTSWMHLTKSGNTFTLRVDENNGSSQRSGTIELVSGGKRVVVPIKQTGLTTLSVTSDYLNYNSSGGSKTINVTSNSSWNIGTGTASWGHLSRNGNVLTVRIDPNNSSSTRSDWFSIKAGNKEKRINISQSGKSPLLSVSTDNINFDYSGGTKTITISTNGTWGIGTGTASWGHLSKNGNILYVKIDKNTTSSSRSDWFTIKAGNKEKRINITQKANTTSSSKSAIIHSVKVENDVDVSGKKGLSVKVSFNVIGMKEKEGKVSCYFYDANGKALLDTNNSYCTSGTPSYVAVSRSIKPIYDNSKYTDYEITIPYEELHLSNTNYTTLRVDVLIWDYSLTPHKSLTRKENTTFTCIPDISYLQVDGSTSNKTKYFCESGGRKYYSVSTNASSYETWGVPSWCNIENKTSSGFTLVCKRNSAVSSRNDYFKVKAAGKEIRIDVKQEGASGPSAEIERIWVDHNIFRNYVKGMLIHVRFSIENMKNRQCNVIAAFYYADNTTPMKNPYGGSLEYNQYGNVTYDSARWDDFTIFVPYQGLFISGSGSGTFTFDIIVKDNNGNKLARQNNTSFTYWQ